MNETLTLHMHPLSSFCQKVLVSLYENGTPFEKHVVDLGNEASRGQFLKLWPVGKFPVLRVEPKGETIPESTIIIEYLDQHHPGRTRLVPSDPERARETRFLDRFYDLYVQLPMQKIVGDRIRAPGTKDAFGVEQAKGQLTTSYGIIDQQVASRTWALGEEFTMADCAAAPALYYANWAFPIGDSFKNAAAYLQRLVQRASYARALEEARPFFGMFPAE